MTHSTMLMAAARTAGFPAVAMATAPCTNGFVLWLDAADRASVQTDANGRVKLQRDKSPAGSSCLFA